MAVIITNMDMPKKCDECPLADDVAFFCGDTDKDIEDYWREGIKPFDCPLKSADEMNILLDKANYEGFERGYLQAVSDCKVQIDNMIAEIEDYKIMENPIGYILRIIHKYCDKEVENDLSKMRRNHESN